MILFSRNKNLHFLRSIHRMNYLKIKILIFGAILIGSFALLYFTVPSSNAVIYDSSASVGANIDIKINPESIVPEFVVTHIDTPDGVKAIYMSACVAATPSFRNKLVKLVDETELNSLIIDVKDYTGTVAFESGIKTLEDTVSGGGCRVADMKEFLGELHDKGIYTIARITVFQDPYFTKTRPHTAVKKFSNKSVTWKDYKGISFVDAGSREFWKHVVEISKVSYEIGFDELNYDYIRFPSDGNMKDIYYPVSEEKVNRDPNFGKAKVVQSFAKYLKEELGDTGAVLSADLFGMTMTNSDDLNIGQVLEYLAPYFDYIAPMVYPSHYPKGFNGYQNVNAHAYDIVKFSMDKGVERMLVASSTPSKLRPWLQDNDYPVRYTPEMVREQIQATYDAGLNSWMLWDAGNTYTRAALEKK